MISFNSLRAIAPLCVALLLLPADGLQARTRKGDKLYKLGTEAEARKEYDKALEYYQEALSTDPKETIYELATRRTRFESGQEHVKAGKKLLAARRAIASQIPRQRTDEADQRCRGRARPGRADATRHRSIGQRRRRAIGASLFE